MDGFFIVRGRALRDLMDLARRAAEEMRDMTGVSTLADCLDGSVAEIEADLDGPVACLT
jgi:hypothetical protein